MKIAYFHYLEADDSALNHVRQFVAAAHGLGHQIDVHSLHLEPPGEGGDTALQSAWGRSRSFLRYHFRYFLHQPKDLVHNAARYRRERRLLLESRPDILLVRTHSLTFSSLVAARRLGIPTALEVNSPVEEGRLYGSHYLRLPRLSEIVEGWSLRQSDAVVTVSSALKQHLIDRHDLPETKITVSPNGADVSSFAPTVQPERRFSERLHTSPVVGFIGSFHKWHGPQLLAEMIREVSEARPRVSFLIVGDGPGRALVAEHLASLGERVVFTGRVPHEEIPGLVACMDIGVMPESNFYGSPLKVIEWMSAGKAVVAPSYGPLQEVISDGETGLLFPPRIKAALVDAVLRLVDTPTLRREIGGRARERVVSSLTWSHNAQRVLGACQQALEHQTDTGR